uniref:RGS domain-containing protein n=1 Tax=Gouania willdenowi TaxID=441366 RepID=A0A8C5GFT0_GOUWI
MEEMLQVLCVDSCSGSYFTHFCEQSGNQLWVNAVYFWTDLQHYRALFYQDGLDLYRVQREAQRSLVVDEQAQRKVCDRLLPAFEELFDEVEEHALNILLEPWALLVNREKECFQQVITVKRLLLTFKLLMRHFFSSLKNKSATFCCHLKRIKGASVKSCFHPLQVQHTSSSKGPTTSVPWSSVSPDYHGYRLGSLLLHNHDIGHFQSFLQIIHLACWLDLEQYKETPVQDQAMRQELSTSITEKYLNNTYLFGPDSPATTEQQKDIVNLAGGLEHLKMECLSNLVAMEISDIVKAYIEKTWLPLFVTTPEFTERQKHKPKVKIHIVHTFVEGLWMSSSKDILLFRQALLDPVTCQQFQHFVSLKGNFLENDLLFWLEVQRYKDLCHSHSDEATIQQKISTIISCFINSSIRPGLQIDIPLQQAQHILEKRDQLGPYIFREAQVFFGELLRLWPEFQEFRSSMEEEQLLPVLHDQRVKFRARVRRQRRKEEEEEEERREQVRKQGG